MEQLAADAATWVCGTPAAGKIAGLQMVSIRTPDARYPSFQPCLTEHIGSMRVLYEPSVYNGTGTEERVNIVMSIEEDAVAQLQAMEQIVRDKVNAQNWNSCVHTTDKGWTFKAKIRVRGDGRVKCFDRSRNEVSLPTQWRGYSVVPIVEVKGVYIQKQSSGLVLEVSAVILGENPNAKVVGASSFR